MVEILVSFLGPCRAYFQGLYTLTFRDFSAIFDARYAEVFFVPGNHDLWTVSLDTKVEKEVKERQPNR